jgi:hypothetical protein
VSVPPSAYAAGVLLALGWVLLSAVELDSSVLRGDGEAARRWGASFFVASLVAASLLWWAL